MQTKRIGRETAHGHCLLPVHALLAVAISVVAIVIALSGGYRFPKMKRRRRSCPASIFPLGFAGETIRHPVFNPQFLDERLAILPGNAFNRKVLFALETAGIVAH